MKKVGSGGCAGAAPKGKKDKEEGGGENGKLKREV